MNGVKNVEWEFKIFKKLVIYYGIRVNDKIMSHSTFYLIKKIIKHTCKQEY